jgi:hypothetical protein
MSDNPEPSGEQARLPDDAPDEPRIAWAQHARELDAMHRAASPPPPAPVPSQWYISEEQSGDEWDPHFEAPLNAFGARTRILIDISAVAALVLVAVVVVAIAGRYRVAAMALVVPLVIVGAVAIGLSHESRWARFMPVNVEELRRLRRAYPIERPSEPPPDPDRGPTNRGRLDAWSSPNSADPWGDLQRKREQTQVGPGALLVMAALIGLAFVGMNVGVISGGTAGIVLLFATVITIACVSTNEQGPRGCLTVLSAVVLTLALLIGTCVALVALA